MDGIVALAGLVLLFVLVVVPVVAFRANTRSHELESEVKRMRAELLALREALDSRLIPERESVTSGDVIKAQETPAVQPAPDVTAEKSVSSPLDPWTADYRANVRPVSVVADEPRGMPFSEPSPQVQPAVSPETLPTASEAANSEPDSEVQTAVRSTDSSESQVIHGMAHTPEKSAEPVPSQQAATAHQDDYVGANDRGLLSALFDWFMRGNPLAKVGILLLFFGLAYLIKYSIERDIFPIELRLGAAAAIALGLLGLGWRLRQKQSLYALILQGGATGALYITVLGACQLWDLVPHGLAFGLLVVICAASVALAILQRSLSLAMLASAGGYLAPVLLSTGSGNYIALFSYYLLLSLGILAITVRQPWRPLNLLGFVFSFGVAGLWGMRDYQPEYWLVCQLFLLASLFIFGIFSNLLSLRAHISGAKIVDSVMMLGPPLVGFGMQYAITAHWKYGAAFSALGFGLIYLALAGFTVRRIVLVGKPFVISALALGVCFTTLAIPLALSAKWTAFAWAIEGLGILWIGLQQQQRYVSYSGTALLVFALGSAVYAAAGLDRFSFCLVFGIISLTWIAAAWLWRKQRTELETGLLGGGILLWVITLIRSVQLEGITDIFDVMLLLVLITLSALIWFAMAKRLKWLLIGYGAWLLWPAMLLALVAQFSVKASLSETGWINLAWPCALAAALWLLRRGIPRPQERIAQGLLAGVILVWVGVLIKLVQPASLHDAVRMMIVLALIALSVLFWLWLATRLHWPLLSYSTWLLWPAMLVTLGCQLSTGGSLFNAGWINLVWPGVLMLAFYLLRHGQPRPAARVAQGLHLSLLWMILLALGVELIRLLDTLPWGMTEWKLGLAVGVGVLVVQFMLYALRRGLWPFVAMPLIYGGVGLAPILLALAAYAIAGNICDGVMIGWPYIPLINPLDVSAGLALCSLVLWARFAMPYLVAKIPHEIMAYRWLAAVVLVAWWGNGMVLRTLSYYGNVDWLVSALWASHLVQTTMSLLWGLTALAIMIGSARRGGRNGWFIGAAILGVIIVKLFLVDSAHGGGLMRAIAFIGVAILMLIIGYFSPLPPRAERRDAMENKE